MLETAHQLNNNISSDFVSNKFDCCSCSCCLLRVVYKASILSFVLFFLFFHLEKFPFDILEILFKEIGREIASFIQFFPILYCVEDVFLF